MLDHYTLPQQPDASAIIDYIAARICSLERSKPIDALPELHSLLAYAEGRKVDIENVELSESYRVHPFLFRCTNVQCREPLNIRVPLIFKNKDMIAYCPFCQTRNVYPTSNFFKTRG